MFIFDALLEAFVFGQTWISVDDIKKEYDRLKTPSPHGNSSILEDEFNVSQPHIEIPFKLAI